MKPEMQEIMDQMKVIGEKTTAVKESINPQVEQLRKLDYEYYELSDRMYEIQSKCEHVWGEAQDVTKEDMKRKVWARTCSNCGLVEETSWYTVPPGVELIPDFSEVEW